MSNQDNAIRGQSFQKVLRDMMGLFVKVGYIKDFKKNYRIGNPEYLDKSQFYAPYLITFEGGVKWAVFSTTSLRDRIKSTYWDAYNLKRLDEKIEKAFLVFPDGLPPKELQKFIDKNDAIQTRKEYCTLDALLSQDAFFDEVERHALQQKSMGARVDKEGRVFECRIAAILDNKYNFEKWKNSSAQLEGLHYRLYERILSTFGLNRGDVDEIRSTSDVDKIGKLPSGGSPKTDVLTTVVFKDKEERKFTISCKKSTGKATTVHEYSADQFADVLDSKNNGLRRALKDFQSHGNMKDMKNPMALSIALKPYVLNLCKWALGGLNGYGDPDIQWARYLLVLHNRGQIGNCDVYDYQIEKVDEYSKRLISEERYAAFGTPFSWTRPSSKKGKPNDKIVLKLNFQR